MIIIILNKKILYASNRWHSCYSCCLGSIAASLYSTYSTRKIVSIFLVVACKNHVCAYFALLCISSF